MLAVLASTVIGFAPLQADRLSALKTEFDVSNITVQRAYAANRNNLEKIQPILNAFAPKCEKDYLPRALDIARKSKSASRRVEAYEFALRLGQVLERPNPAVLGSVWDEYVLKLKASPLFLDSLIRTRLSLGVSPSLAQRFGDFESGAVPAEAKAGFAYAESLMAGGPNATADGRKKLLAVIAKYPQSKSAKRAKDVLKLRESMQSGKLAPALRFNCLDGGTFDVSKYKGKVVVIDFWGFWCPGCVEELSELKKLRSAHPESELVMLSVSTDSWPNSYYGERAKEAGLNWSQANVGTPYNESVAKLGVSVYPTKLVVDAQGVIRVFGPNFLNQDWMATTEKLLR